jgi:hypothetical protein
MTKGRHGKGNGISLAEEQNTKPDKIRYGFCQTSPLKKPIEGRSDSVRHWFGMARPGHRDYLYSPAGGTPATRSPNSEPAGVYLYCAGEAEMQRVKDYGTKR